VIVILVVIALLVEVFKQELSAMLTRGHHMLLAFAGVGLSQSSGTSSSTIDLSWHPPKQTQINNITAVMAGKGVYGFIYNSSDTPNDRYGTYNWCNMPHVRKKEYVKAPSEYDLVYVELVCLITAITCL
jgi:acid phosphatase